MPHSPHSGLNGATPFSTHFNSHTSSEVARYQAGMFGEQQRQAFRLFRNNPENRFDVGSDVLVRSRRHAFHKNSAVFYPSFEEETYKVESICKKYLPWKYYVRGSQSGKMKQLYCFEMRRIITNSNLNIEPVAEVAPHRIYIKDVILQEHTKLRSGKIMPNKSMPYYRILVDEKQDIVSEKALRLLKRALGRDAIIYGSFFDLPANKRFIIV